MRLSRACVVKVLSLYHILALSFFVCGCDVLFRPILAPQNSRCFCFLLFEGVLSVISFIIKLIRKPNELFCLFYNAFWENEWCDSDDKQVKIMCGLITF